jgi:hypothetical protein
MFRLWSFIGDRDAWYLSSAGKIWGNPCRSSRGTSPVEWLAAWIEIIMSDVKSWFFPFLSFPFRVAPFIVSKFVPSFDSYRGLKARLCPLFERRPLSHISITGGTRDI